MIAFLRSLVLGRGAFSGKVKVTLANAFLEINAGAGGAEANDWASMLLRMYLRWAERHGVRADLVDIAIGDVVGIKTATV